MHGKICILSDNLGRHSRCAGNAGWVQALASCEGPTPMSPISRARQRSLNTRQRLGVPRYVDDEPSLPLKHYLMLYSLLYVFDGRSRQKITEGKPKPT